MKERLAAVTAHLLQIASASEAPHPHSRPPQVRHQFCQAPTGAGPATALRNLKDIEQKLCSNALNAIVADFTAHTFQR
jgi:hypothetical protein